MCTADALLVQSRCWQVSVKVLRAFKEAVSNWLDLDLFVVKREFEMKQQKPPSCK